VKFPWYPSPLCRIKIEITHDEPVMLEAERRNLIHGHQEDLAASLRGYPLAEIVAEKMRALLQTQQKLLARGWKIAHERVIIMTCGESCATSDRHSRTSI
jgi:predicted nucleotidyltransferase component of viral defense system